MKAKGAEPSGVPFRKALELLDGSIRGRNLVQLGMSKFTNSPQLAAYAASPDVTVFPGQANRATQPSPYERRGRAAVDDPPHR